jgi:hypothetical protein
MGAVEIAGPANGVFTPLESEGAIRISIFPIFWFLLGLLLLIR